MIEKTSVECNEKQKDIPYKKQKHGYKQDIQGLSGTEVKKLTEKGLINGTHDAKTKSVAIIIKDNICTLFNLINIVLAVMVAIVGSYKNMLFMGVIICNILIGIIQQIRAKKVIDKLTILSTPRVRVIRDGIEQSIDMKNIVLGDYCIICRGDQICADSEIIDGECEVDESLLTGESDPVYKKKGDSLLSGSFLTSGMVTVKTIHVGADNYAYKLVHEAKYMPKINSEMMQSINKIIKIVSICILPLAAILFYKQCFLIGQDYETAIISTVAAIIAMIPEGLVLLTSIILAVSIVRLSREKTLVQELYCIETLARVNMLCLDKTGTLTEGRLIINRLEEITISDNEKQFKEPVYDKIKKLDKEKILGTISRLFTDSNQTLDAVKNAYEKGYEWKAEKVENFSSEKKMSSIKIENMGTFYMGAAERILSSDTYIETIELSDIFASEGYRVLLLAYSETDLKKAFPLCFILLEDKIREEAIPTLRYFADQGVLLKIISGDHPATVAAVAKRAGLMGAEKYIDAGRLKTDKDYSEAVVNYNVFGRVSPAQKVSLIKALKKKGYTVGMTGDGVNDVLALKEADCSVAMKSGSDAARNVSKLVLLESNFSAMPKVVAEGRRSINNLERSAALFLEKTTYAFLLALIFVFISEPYPFKPIQMTLINALTIGIPSFLLALEPNYNVVKGHFFKNVMRKALPGGILVTLNVITTIILGNIVDARTEQISTVCVVITAAVSFMVLFRICKPWNLFRRLMYIILITAFIIAVLGFREFFQIESLSVYMLMVIGGQSIVTAVCLPFLSKFTEKIID